MVKRKYFISSNGLSFIVDKIRREDIILWLEMDNITIGSFWLTEYKLKHRFSNENTVYFDIVKK